MHDPDIAGWTYSYDPAWRPTAYNATGHVDAPSSYDLGPDNYSYDANGSQTGRSNGPLPQSRMGR